MATWLYWLLVVIIGVFVALPVAVALWWSAPGWVAVVFLAACVALAVVVDRRRRHRR